MWYLRALAVAVVAVPLVVGTGCVTKQTYDRDIQVERTRADKATIDLAKAKADLKKANDAVTELNMKVADVSRIQQQLDGERKRADDLQASIKTEVAKAKKSQEQADAEKVALVGKTEHTLREQLTKANAKIAELTKDVDRLKKSETIPARKPPVTPPAAPTVTPPAAVPPSTN